MGTKVCKKCGEEKELSFFSKYKDGIRSECKICRKRAKSDYAKNSLARRKEYRKKYNQDHKEEIKQYYLDNKEKVKEYYGNNIDHILEKKKEYNKKIAKYETYKDKLTIEESPMCGKDGELLCKCSHCGEYHPVINVDVKNRISSLMGHQDGENRFYCSDDCKIKYDVFGAQLTPKSMRGKTAKARCNHKTNRKMLLDLQMDEFGYTHCEVCGKPFPRKQLILHHNIPVGDDISEADNMRHQIIVCKNHHQHNGCLGKQ